MAKFYERQEIYAKALKIYTSGKLFVDFMLCDELFPLEIRLKRLKQSDLQNSFSTIRDELNLLQKESLELTYKEFNFKTIGLQKLPLSVVFKDRNMLLGFIRKNEEFIQFVKDFNMIIMKYPILKELLHVKPFLVIEYHDIWSKFFSVCDFF
ncbi:MAG: hypothetical protein J7L21_05420, partial [Sulfurimonas sp.]|nr:hypothetical protein [Sulfurimonas sp.]